MLALPCNQFGLQENSSEKELLAVLEHVRPGNGFKPAFPIFGKVLINGPDAHPAYKFLKEGADAPPSEKSWIYLTDTSPVVLSTKAGEGSDVQWNFEKFLVGRDGKVIGRFSHSMAPEDVAASIEAAL